MPTIATETASVSYTGSGTTGPFTVPFYFLEDSHLSVIQEVIASGVQTTLTLTTDYTVDGAGDAAGGTVELEDALSSDYKLHILRDVPITQETAYPRNDTFPAASHERALNKLTMIAQQQQEAIDRGMLLAPGSGLSDITFPSPGAGEVIRWNADGDGLETVSLDDVGDTFLQSGSGTVARSWTAKVGEHLSVKDFGATGDGVTDDAAAIDLAVTAADGKQLIWPAGTYNMTAAVAHTLTANQQWVALGPVTIVWGGAEVARMFYITTAGFDFRIEGPFIFDADELAREPMRIEDAAVGTGAVTIQGAEFRNGYSSEVGSGSNGLNLAGGFGHVEIDGAVFRDISRDAGVGDPGVVGSIGLAITQSGSFYAVHVEITRCRFIGVTSEEADSDGANVDCDGLVVTGPSGASFSNEHPATMLVVRGCRFEDNRGRHIKGQGGYVDVSGSNFIRDTFKTIADGTDIDIQYGQGDVHDNRFFYNDIAGGTPFGASFAAVTASVSTDTTVAGALTVRDNTVVNNYPAASGDMPYFVSLSVGASATFRSVTVENNKLMGSGRVGSLIRAAGSGGFAAGQVIANNNYCARLGSHLLNFVMSIATARVSVSGNVSAEGTLRALVHSDVSGGVPFVSGYGANVGFIEVLTPNLSGLTEAPEVVRAHAFGAPGLRDGPQLSPENLACANGATVTFKIRGYIAGRGMYFLISTGGRVQCAIFSHDGTALNFSPAGANGVTVGDGADPAVAGDLNVWMDTTAIKVRNDTGGDVVLSLWSIG